MLYKLRDIDPTITVVLHINQLFYLFLFCNNCNYGEKEWIQEYYHLSEIEQEGI